MKKNGIFLSILFFSTTQTMDNEFNRIRELQRDKSKSKVDQLNDKLDRCKNDCRPSLWTLLLLQSPNERTLKELKKEVCINTCHTRYQAHIQKIHEKTPGNN